MSARESLRVLVRLNELSLLGARAESTAALAALRSAEKSVERQDERVAHAARKYASTGSSRSLDVAAYQLHSGEYQSGLDALRALEDARARCASEHQQLARECLELDRRGKTLERVLASRRIETERVRERRTLRELDVAWLQRPEAT